MIYYKSPREIQIMKKAGRIVAETLDLLFENVRPGVTTRKLDEIASEYIESCGAKSAFLGYQGYPANICVSIDEVVVHGIPGDRKLVEGQIVSFDVGVIYEGYHGDSARTYPVGEIDEEAQRLMKTTEEALHAGIKTCIVGNCLGNLSAAIQQYAESRGYSVVRDLVGHGIGRKMHEEPQVPNFGEPNTGMEFKEGLVMAIEPMINAGGYEVRFLADGWTVSTVDCSLSAHFEHTVAITADGPQILTVR